MPLAPSRRYAVSWLLLLVIIALALPRSAAASPMAGVTLSFEVVAVKVDESVTVRTKDFPIRTKFKISIGDAVKKPFEGIVVLEEWNSGSGGNIDIDLSIPAEFKDRRILAVRMESADGYTAQNWFFNRTQASLAASSAAQTPEMVFSQIRRNTSALVEVKNLPPDTTYRVRAGPYETFYRDYIALPSVTSDANGTLAFTVEVPPKAKDAGLVMVRIDQGAQYVYNVFHNLDGGTTADSQDLVKYVPCMQIMVKPIQVLKPREEFDVVWTVQNSGYLTWPVGTVDFQFAGGAKIHKYADVVDINWPVRRGSVFRLTVDMIAPEQPGWYTTKWSLVQAEKTLCTLSVTVAVTGEP